MKKLMRKISVFCVITMMIIGMSIPVYAETTLPELGKVVDGSVLTEENVSEVTLYNRARGNILNRGIARASDNGNGSVNAYAAAIGAVTCDRLELTIVLQRYTGSYWVDVASRSYSASNVAMLSKSFNTTVTKGYYYRVKAACVAKDGGAIESQMPVTDGVFVD